MRSGRSTSGKSASPYLVYLRDKAMLWNGDRSGFVMYGVQGRTWVALGDPVGPPQAAPGLIREFLERADDYAADGVFYEVSKGALHLYADFGLTFVKVGENASVPLASFSLQGPERKPLRNAVTRLDPGGRPLPRGHPRPSVPAVLPELRGSLERVARRAQDAARRASPSDSSTRRTCAAFPWPSSSAAAGSRRSRPSGPAPAASSCRWTSMRFRPDAPKNVMEALFVHVMQWGHEQGYGRLALGMAPLSGFESSPVAPLWMRLGRFLYSHGESLYNFQGLRAFKDKFQPVWEPRYLAYPGGPRAAANPRRRGGPDRRRLSEDLRKVRSPRRSPQGPPLLRRGTEAGDMRAPNTRTRLDRNAQSTSETAKASGP